MKHPLALWAFFAAAILLVPVYMLKFPIQKPIQNLQAEPVIVEKTVNWVENTQEIENENAETVESLQVADDGFDILDERTGEVFTVSAKEYTRGALAAEMPPTFHPEALKAQAVAAHTYALHQKQVREGEGYDLTADPENWKSYTTQEIFFERYGQAAPAYWQAICDAADAVAPYLLAYEGEPIVAAYCSMSAGQTEDAGNVWEGGAPYLVPVESPGDTRAPDYETTACFSAEEMRQLLLAAWPQAQLEGDPSGWIVVGERSESGYVTQVEVGGIQAHGKELREALDLRSSWMEISYTAAQGFSILVRGYGHGVGLSQYGADYMARQGASFDEILLHYYPGTTLTVAANAE